MIICFNNYLSSLIYEKRKLHYFLKNVQIFFYLTVDNRFLWICTINRSNSNLVIIKTIFHIDRIESNQSRACLIVIQLNICTSFLIWWITTNNVKFSYNWALSPPTQHQYCFCGLWVDNLTLWNFMKLFIVRY